MAKFCSECGTKIEGDEVFCSECGTRLKGTESPEASHNKEIEKAKQELGQNINVMKDIAQEHYQNVMSGNITDKDRGILTKVGIAGCVLLIASVIVPFFSVPFLGGISIFYLNKVLAGIFIGLAVFSYVRLSQNRYSDMLYAPFGIILVIISTWLYLQTSFDKMRAANPMLGSMMVELVKRLDSVLSIGALCLLGALVLLIYAGVMYMISVRKCSPAKAIKAWFVEKATFAGCALPNALWVVVLAIVIAMTAKEFTSM